MLPLRELQQTFAAALFDSEIAPLAAAIAPNGIDPVERIGFYRNNLHAGFRKALALTFPVIEQLVGQDYFTQLARDYQADHPSRSGDLHHIGGALAGFLRQRFFEGEFAYLSDVAALEWACEEIGVAELKSAASVEDLRRVDPASYESLTLGLSSAVRLVASQYPIVRIWMTNQPGAVPETINLDAGGDSVLVCVGAGGLEFHRLRSAEFVLAMAAAEGLTLGEAAERALAAADESFDLARGLQRLLHAGALVFPAISTS
jgi:hypothetical protein